MESKSNNNRIIKTLSASAINTYNQCPYAFYLLYVIKIIQKPSIALRVGSAFHQAVELFHSTDKKPEEILEIIKKDFITCKEDIKEFNTVKLMIKKYFANPIEDKTIATEQRFKLDVPGLPVPLTGILDRLTLDGYIDYKTTSEDYDANKITDNPQWKIYRYAYQRLYNKIPNVTYYVINKKKIKRSDYKPQIIKLIANSDDEIEETEQYLRDFYQKIQNGKFPKCKKPYCFVKEYCK